MTLSADRYVLDVLYGPRIKIIAPASDAARLQRALNGNAVVPPAIELLAFHPAAPDSAARLRRLSGPDAEAVTVDHPPSGACLLAALTPQGRSELSELTTWWSKHGHGSPTVVELPENGAPEYAGAEMYRRLFQLAWQEVQRGDKRNAQLYSELYELRKEYEQARGAMLTMRDHLDRIRQAPCHMVQLLPPSAGVFQPSQGNATLRQVLSVRAEGLAGFDLFSPPLTDASADGQLLLTLRARESDAVLGAWSVPYASLGRGWLRCGFPLALSDSWHHLELIVNWQTAAGTPPPLALSAIGPWHEMSAVVDNQPLGAALAQIIWCGVAGTRVGSSAARFLLGAAAGSDDSLEYRFGPEEINRIVPTSDTKVEYAAPLPDGHSFRLHPLDGIIASAVLPNACLPGTLAVAAIAQITHPEARFPVEFAMCLTPADGLRDFPADPEMDPRVLAFSGWQSVSADRQPHALIVSLDQPAGTGLDLHAATRMTDGNPSAHQWADWLEFRVELTYSAPVSPPSPP